MITLSSMENLIVECNLKWVSKRENWTLLHVENKSVDQPGHLRGLISTYVILYVESIVVNHARYKITAF